MKFLICSDIHGDYEAVRKTIDIFEEEGCDRLVILGDVLYHGPRNDLPREYAPKEVIAMLNPIASKIIAVRGNCDTEVDQMVLSFPVLSEEGVIADGEHRIYLIHGHKNLEARANLLGHGDVLLYGHTHVPSESEGQNGCKILNPGSISIPKENSGHAYMIYDKGVFSRYTLE